MRLARHVLCSTIATVYYIKKKPYAHKARLMRIRAYAMLMRKAYARLMREAYAGCLCTAYAQCLCED